MITNNNMERPPYSEVWILVSVYTGWLQGQRSLNQWMTRG